jgi:hypothetical protein
MALADGKGRQDGPGRIPPRKTADPGDGAPDTAVGPRLWYSNGRIFTLPVFVSESERSRGGAEVSDTSSAMRQLPGFSTLIRRIFLLETGCSATLTSYVNNPNYAGIIRGSTLSPRGPGRSLLLAPEMRCWATEWRNTFGNTLPPPLPPDDY